MGSFAGCEAADRKFELLQGLDARDSENARKLQSRLENPFTFDQWEVDAR
jgi:hypothetical protein